MHLWGWHTPNTNTGTAICRPLSVPLPYLSSVAGALAALTDPGNWEQVGAVTPEQAAETMTAMLLAWAGDCAGGACTVEFELVDGVLRYRNTPEDAWSSLGNVTGADGAPGADGADGADGAPGAPGTSFTSVGAKYTSDTAVVTASGVEKRLNFEDVAYDTHSAVTIGASWVFTVPAGLGGRYLMVARIAIPVSQNVLRDGESVRIAFYRNGARFDESWAASNIPSGAGVQMEGTGIVNCAPGDTLWVIFSQNSGSALTMGQGADSMNIAVERIGI